MKKKIISTVLAATMTFGVGHSVFATPLTDDQKQQMEHNQDKYADINSKIRELEDKIDGLSAKIEPLFFQVEKNKEEISKTEESISTVKVQIEESKKKIEKQQEVLGQRIRATYKSGGQANYLTALLDSNGIGDFLSRVQAISKVMGMDKQVIDELTSEKEKLDSEVKELQDKTTELNKLNSETQSKIDELNKMKAEQEGVIKDMKAEQEKVVGELAPLERQLMEPWTSKINSNSSLNDLNQAVTALRGLRNQIKTPEVDAEAVQAIEKAKDLIETKKAEEAVSSAPNRGGDVNTGGSSSSASNGSSSSNSGSTVAPPSEGAASAVVSYAYQFIGRPYVFGATGPDTFDCSGFTSYVYRNAVGREITRTTYTQINQGRPVSRDQLQPGDLVFTNGVGHVGIYVGGGQMIHAARPGVGVIVGPIYNFSSARRIL
ncbi:NlpC/P60 family protein [Clostridium perfringens]|uniref:NlpC/P60 family n=1 Tax=Clostridium perfringens (strain SM101 / Type A) TaxID=289380 RepID=Q0SWA5_CLOPS|nr:C40 family peptidase [Clostridium perfringens]ABG86564.1 NlpC/P60 family [Clostridium perfringens SM101]MBP2860317.1 C40 family peptidase [Clostridium perfringens]MDG6877687.1 Peptidoglycan DL-endopeptidase CwlO precursor [Clostridium perfringens]MDG6880180.1 Peptidoglycan DL-endopeptidase CwlO precursor [Clostridium perfringens]MDH5061448.1 Peptidoglycan DL-endopeptidase CwlO precursor [Clostridium perfringens NCTC 8239]